MFSNWRNKVLLVVAFALALAVAVPGVAHALQLEPQPGDSLIVMLLKSAASVVIPGAATWFAMWLSKHLAFVNNLNDWEKRIVVLVYGLLIQGLAHALKIALPDGIGQLGPGEVQLMLSTAFAFLMHRFLAPKSAARGR